jgi:hypothetical protein
MPHHEVCDGIHRGWQAVEVEAVEAHLPVRLRTCGVHLPQPFDKVADGLVSPHPDRKPLKGLERGGQVRLAADIGVDTGGVRPVGLHRDDGEPMLPDQPFRHRSAGTVELVRAVRRLPKEDDLRPRVAIDETRKCRVRYGRQRLRGPLDCRDSICVHRSGRRWLRLGECGAHQWGHRNAAEHRGASHQDGPARKIRHGRSPAAFSSETAPPACGSRPAADGCGAAWCVRVDNPAKATPHASLGERSGKGGV